MFKFTKPVPLLFFFAVMLNVTPVYAAKQPMMDIGLNNLIRAEKSLQMGAWNKGGHRIKALFHVRKAIEEINKAKAFADKKSK